MTRYKHIPVTLHIPRNSGTYQSWLFQRFLVNSFEDTNMFNVRRICVNQPTYSLIFYCYMNDQAYLSDDRMDQTTEDERQTLCTMKTFLEYLRSDMLTIMSVFIVSKHTDNLDMRDSWFDVRDVLKIQNSIPYNFITIRDTFSRQQSIHNYLSSIQSKHEPTHKALTRKLHDYVCSDKLEDSWLIRCLTGMPMSSAINRHWYSQALKFITDNDIKIVEIDHVIDSLEIIYKLCFDISFIKKVVTNNNILTMNTNKSRKMKIPFHKMSKKARVTFLSRTRWDRYIYQTLVKHSIYNHANSTQT